MQRRDDKKSAPLHAGNCGGRLQRTESVPCDKAENGSSSCVTGADSSSSSHAPYWQYLEPCENSSRSELYHTRTGKMAAHRQHSKKRNLSSTPPWKPAGLSPTRYPYLEANIPMPKPKNNTKMNGRCDTTSQQTTPLIVPPHVRKTAPVPSQVQPHQTAHCEKRVSFLESPQPTPRGTPSCVKSPYYEGKPCYGGSQCSEDIPSCIESPCSEGMPSHVEGPAPAGTPSHVEGPAPVGTPSRVEGPAPVGTPSRVEGPAPVGTPSRVEGPSPVGTPSRVEGPSPEGTPSHVEGPSPEGTPSHVESPHSPYTPSRMEIPSPEGTSIHGRDPVCSMPRTAWTYRSDGVAAKDSNRAQLLSEVAKLSQCTDKLLKQLEEAKKEMAARYVLVFVYLQNC